MQIKARICLYLLHTLYLFYTHSVAATPEGEIEELHSVKLVTGIPTSNIPTSSTSMRQVSSQQEM